MRSGLTGLRLLTRGGEFWIKVQFGFHHLLALRGLSQHYHFGQSLFAGAFCDADIVQVLLAHFWCANHAFGDANQPRFLEAFLRYIL